jgi:aldehyde dehydrogenase (NAD+)
MSQTTDATFTTHRPESGEVFANYPNTSATQVQEAIDRARESQIWWGSQSAHSRRKILLAWNQLLTKRIDEGAQLVSAETGKPFSDAKLETSLAIGHLGWAARKASFYLKTSKRSPGLLMANMSAQVERSAFGVVGVIGPWNYPIFTPMGSISYALAAGNTVVFKPSEFTPAVAIWLEATLREIHPEHDLLTVIPGLPDTGKFLTSATRGVDKISFTGSTVTAKKVAATCVEKMIPFVLECGGKDPVIVDKDANLALAAEFTLWSGMSNGGQTCIGAERVYVHETVADEFIELLKVKAASISAGHNYGPATMPRQLEIIQSHIDSALHDGGSAIVGGSSSVHKPFVDPVIICEVDESSPAITEETFGPVLIVNRVPDMDEAIKRSNATSYGLAAAVWSKHHGHQIASQLKCGMVSINSVISFAAIASLPFGGVKNSGMGRIHGPEGLLEFTYPRSIVKPYFQLPLKFTTFNRTARADKVITGIVKFLHGKSIG